MPGKVDSFVGSSRGQRTLPTGTFVLAALAELAMADQMTGTKTPGYPGQLAIRIAWRAVVGWALVVVRNGVVERCVREIWRGEVKCTPTKQKTGMWMYVYSPVMIEDGAAWRVDGDT